jgi:MFS family permease
VAIGLKKNPNAEGAVWHLPFRIRAFRLLWSANLASAFGSMIQAVAASWMMASMESPPLLVALVQTGTTLPIMLFALVAGAIADRVSRRNIMLATQTFLLLVSSILTALTWLGALAPLTLLIFTFLIGTGVAFNAPAWQAMVGDLVPRRHLDSAVALNSLAFNLARTAGPALGGFVLFVAGPVIAFGTNALSYLGLVACLILLRIPRERDDLPPERLHRAIAGGVRFAWHAHNVRSVLLRSAVFGIAACAMPALLPLVARETLSGGAPLYGLLLACFGSGAVVGSLAAVRLRRGHSLEPAILLGSMGVAIGTLIAGISSSAWFTGIGLFAAGAGWVATLSTFNVTVQLSAPRWVAARVLASYQMTTFGGMAAGSLAWGLVAQVGGVEKALILAAVLGAAGPVLRRWWPIADPRKNCAGLMDPWLEPARGIAQADEGPVLISIDYRIVPEDVPSFLALMVERRRDRLRNGALRWRLIQDVADQDSFIEQYECTTWADYIRHIRRTTRAERETAARLVALNVDRVRPRVRRHVGRLGGRDWSTPDPT